ncbi:MAG: threonine--tRNA ligase [Alphaproteobacteria bacterium]|nr:threonine--tRNA ligase [Alphaproteobacteria bacterium]OJV14156.1 MAG: threonine--tRNA ligase [Alphaproteobacteria bacterium 33-17]
MVKVSLPDGSVRSYEQSSISGMEIAESISKSLAKAAIAIKVNGEAKDLSIILTGTNNSIEIITPESPEGLEIIRHDAAHILAQAIKELYPSAQITIGPVIENGFYYDIDLDYKISTDDFRKIESKMEEIVRKNYPITREVWERDKAVEFFKSIGEHYKAEIIADLPASEDISLYRQGDFIDLCRGPHSPSTSKVKAFKLMKVAGAYWRGDSKNKMLQRIYATAWTNKQDLDNYIKMLEEAEKRDHRKLGKELNLFHIQEEAQGMVFWHDKGWTIYRLVEEYVRNKIRQNGYTEVKTPILVDRILWEKSGHWEKFRENMFVSQDDEDSVLALKPMNCPCHIQIFNHGLKSYKDLPLRMAEFGTCHRNEPTGSLHGLMRVRGFTQDDAHIFCTEDQITSETVEFCRLLKEVYKDFGFTEIRVKFSDRPEKRAGSDEIWDKAEAALKEAVEEAGLEYTLNPGEGAFYGPKLEFVLKDAIGRDWQCGTLQADFVLPERLDASYIAADGSKQRPVMLHRAILGSLERFIGILIENHSGRMPVWLSPIQAVVMSITNEVDEYTQQVSEILERNGIRVKLDLLNDKINYKIRKYVLEKIPFLVVAGKSEAENGTVSVRIGNDPEQKTMTIDELVSFISEEQNNYR